MASLQQQGRKGQNLQRGADWKPRSAELFLPIFLTPPPLKAIFQPTLPSPLNPLVGVEQPVIFIHGETVGHSGDIVANHPLFAELLKLALDVLG